MLLHAFAAAFLAISDVYFFLWDHRHSSVFFFMRVETDSVCSPSILCCGVVSNCCFWAGLTAQYGPDCLKVQHVAVLTSALWKFFSSTLTQLLHLSAAKTLAAVAAPAPAAVNPGRQVWISPLPSEAFSCLSLWLCLRKFLSCETRRCDLFVSRVLCGMSRWVKR